MNSLIQQLQDGTPEHIPTGNEGEIHTINRPPTAIMLRAARELKALYENQETDKLRIHTLTREVEQLTNQVTVQQEQLCKLQSTLESMVSSQAGAQTQPTPDSQSQ